MSYVTGWWDKHFAAHAGASARRIGVLTLAMTVVALVASVAGPAASQPTAAPSTSSSAGKLTRVEIVDGPVTKNTGRARIAAQAAGVACPTRSVSCVTLEKVVIQLGPDNEVIGRYRVYVNLTISSASSSTRSTARISVQVTKELVTSVDGGTLKLDFDALEQYQDPTANGTVRGIRYLSIPVTGGATLNDTDFGYFTKLFQGPNTYSLSTFAVNYFYTVVPGATPINVDGTSYFGNHVRCDNWDKLGTPGCVNPDYIPTVTFDSRTPNIIKNIQAGLAAGQPGGSFNSQLHRDAPENRDTKYRAACSAAKIAALPPVTDPSFTSCDEYPFASTDEGGASATIRLVPVPEQNSQGGTLSRFYGPNRVLAIPNAHDGFYVTLAP